MIRIICVGTLKETYWKEATNEYLKRLSKYTKISMMEIDEEGFADPKTTLSKEGGRILKKIDSKDFVVTLEITGTLLSSEAFATQLNQLEMNHKNIVFVIGGSYGIADSIKQRSDYALSFSKMTFPHQLFRVMLLEQLYRSYKINKNETYHK